MWQSTAPFYSLNFPILIHYGWHDANSLAYRRALFSLREPLLPPGRRSAALLQCVQHALHVGLPLVQPDLQRGPLLAPELPHGAPLHEHHLPQLVHLRLHQSRAHRPDHPLLHLVLLNVQRGGDGAIRDLLVLAREGDEAEEAHVLHAGSLVETEGVEDRDLIGHGRKVLVVLQLSLNEDFEEVAEGRLGLLEGGHRWEGEDPSLRREEVDGIAYGVDRRLLGERCGVPIELRLR